MRVLSLNAAARRERHVVSVDDGFVAPYMFLFLREGLPGLRRRVIEFAPGEMFLPRRKIEVVASRFSLGDDEVLAALASPDASTLPVYALHPSDGMAGWIWSGDLSGMLGQKGRLQAA